MAPRTSTVERVYRGQGFLFHRPGPCLWPQSALGVSGYRTHGIALPEHERGLVCMVMGYDVNAE